MRRGGAFQPGIMGFIREEIKSTGSQDLRTADLCPPPPASAGREPERLHAGID